MRKSKKAVERHVKPLAGKTCGDCPFFIPDLDLCTRRPHDRGYCDINVVKKRRTHVRRAMCERAKQYFPNTKAEVSEEASEQGNMPALWKPANKALTSADEGGVS